jgi:hypothetical protein
MKSAYVPAQHGAWAMLIVPFILGVFGIGPVWLHAPLFLFWLSAYLFSHAFLQWVKTNNIGRYGKPMLWYGMMLAAAGIPLVIGKPSLALWVPAFVPLFFVNVRYARKNRERAFVNDLAAVTQFSLIVFVAWAAAGGGDWQTALSLFFLSLMYFTGTIFYVKTVIREKHNPRFYAMSVLYHAIMPAVAAAAFRSWGIALMFVLLIVRAVWMPRTNPLVKTVGLLEFAMATLFTVSVLAWAA